MEKHKIFQKLTIFYQTLPLTLNWSQNFIWYRCFQICDFTSCCGVGWNTFKVYYSSSSLRNTLLDLNWMPAFLKQPWSYTRSTFCIIWGNNLETFEKLLSMIQSRCSIYSNFLKSLHWNILKLWHQALIVMNITIKDFEKSLLISCNSHI